MHRTRAQRGQTSTEYLGVVVVVAAVIAGLAATGFPQRVGSALTETVCRIVSLGGCGTSGAETTSPAAATGGPPTFGTSANDWDGAGGHAYYIRDSEAVYNMARVIVGAYDEASLCTGTGDDCD